MDKEQWQQRGQGHRERLRDRFLENGLASFSDAEILELLLTFGTPRSDCKQPAKDLLKIFGSFQEVLDAPASALQQVKGVGPKNCFALHFLQAAASHYLKQRLVAKVYLTSSQAVREYLAFAMRGLKVEVLTAIFLDASHRVITTEVVCEGTINANTVHPRELLRKALDHHAAALVIAHNHPSGRVSPSTQDLQLTKTLYLLCSYMQITLLDHLIIGEDTFSFADNGLMAKVARECSQLRQTLSG